MYKTLHKKQGSVTVQLRFARSSVTFCAKRDRYPDGLKGSQISVWSQAVSLADVYDALLSKRCYKDAYSCEKAVSMILGGECGTFNPVLIDSFMEIERGLRGLYLPDTD